MISRIDKLYRKVCDVLTVAFSAVSSIIGLIPIPFSDIIPLTALQVTLVSFIAYFGGKDLKIDSIKELAAPIGLTGVAGMGLRSMAQQILKLFTPGIGSAFSSAIAFSGTFAIGKAATAYFIDKSDPDEIKKNISKYTKEGEDDFKKLNQ